MDLTVDLFNSGYVYSDYLAAKESFLLSPGIPSGQSRPSLASHDGACQIVRGIDRDPAQRK